MDTDKKKHARKTIEDKISYARSFLISEKSLKKTADNLGLATQQLKSYLIEVSKICPDLKTDIINKLQPKNNLIKEGPIEFSDLPRTISRNSLIDWFIKNYDINIKTGELIILAENNGIKVLR